MKKYINHWIYNGEPLLDIPENQFGFVYLITNKIEGKKYIGRKYFWSFNKKKGVRGKIKSESNWKHYYGSSQFVLDDIKRLGKENFKREILSIHDCSRLVNYYEVVEQFRNDVLYSIKENGERIFYNDNILGKFYGPIARQNMSKAKENSEPWNKGIGSEDWKEKLGENYIPPPSLKGKIRITDGSVDIMIDPSQKIPKGFSRGRSCSNVPVKPCRVVYNDDTFKDYPSAVALKDDLKMLQKTFEKLLFEHNDLMFLSKRRKFQNIKKIEYFPVS